VSRYDDLSTGDFLTDHIVISNIPETNRKKISRDILSRSVPGIILPGTSHFVGNTTTNPQAHLFAIISVLDHTTVEVKLVFVDGEVRIKDSTWHQSNYEEQLPDRKVRVKSWGDKPQAG